MPTPENIILPVLNELRAAEQDYYNKRADNLKEDNKSNPKHCKILVEILIVNCHQYMMVISTILVTQTRPKHLITSC